MSYDELYALDVASDKVERYRKDRVDASKHGDPEFLDYLDDDQHQELLTVIMRYWTRMDRYNVDAALPNLAYVSAIDSAINDAINKAVQREIDRGFANEHEPDSNE